MPGPSTRLRKKSLAEHLSVDAGTLFCMPDGSKFEGQFVEETHGYGTPYSWEATASTGGLAAADTR